MRRILKHALIGTSLSAVTATAVIGTVLSGSSANATPPVAPPPGATAPIGDAASRIGDTSRDATRLALSVDPQAAAADDKQVYASARQQQVVDQLAAAKKKAAEAAAKKKAAEAKAKAAAARRAALIKQQGYLPGTTDPRSIARQIMQNKYGWGSDQFACFNNIIMRESMWDVNATNAASGAYGIPQALPGSKMASAGPDWQTNPATQITWGLSYLKDRYGTPCGGWAFKSANGWY
ncbi:hypothetical protein FHX74_002157 [Friedmanniella endophytica]|uniref:Transglycosylase SLT domain-containing protein n=1 Tax=Microlunatus kandeliicorticis TaxID=1759536 RepID=A0A7W3IST3_9ACTN|nr:transglycosylase SLT domain-containing protein [Microlunatus kandeliicorticis]MBA8794538.1 hypothetical protein [Microlunatus kandeliicorticis]